MFDEIKSACGVIHGVVNNAGIGLGKNAIDASESEVDRLYEVDVKGIWMVCRAFVKQLQAAGDA